ncbi:MAG TPA: hypothetical protein VGZ25_08355 [Gemmataceae bacterium]|nr:hypothetical protein [Gemmataceae bacterium]
MRMRNGLVIAALVSFAWAIGSAQAGQTDSLKSGTPTIKSAGPLAFGPEGILFVGDPEAATIFAIDTGDRAGNGDRPKIEGLDEKIASLLGIEAKQLRIVDMAVNPLSGNTYLSVARGKGTDAMPVLVRVERAGKIAEFPVKDVKFASATLPKAAEGDKRKDAITHMAYVKGNVFVAGLSNEEFSSKLRSVPFPFKEGEKEAAVEFFHGSHGRFETASPVRTFVPLDINGEAHLLCAYTCTPLVKIPVKQLEPGKKVKGTTVAELGNRNRPLDMVVYEKGGKEYILMANSARGVMKIPTEGIDKVESITKHVNDKAGLTYETIKDLKGVEHLDRFDKDHALVLIRTDGGNYNLETIELP